MTNLERFITAFYQHKFKKYCKVDLKEDGCVATKLVIDEKIYYHECKPVEEILEEIFNDKNGININEYYASSMNYIREENNVP